MKNALIAGASGLVGSELLKLLNECNQYNAIHVLTRRPLNLPFSRIIEHVIDFDHLDNLKLDFPVHHVFCTLGTTIKKAATKENFKKVDLIYVGNLAKKAKKMNAEKFLVVSSLGANPNSLIFYNKVKGQMEITLSEIDLPHLFIFRPSLLMGDRNEHRTGEKTAIAVYKIINPLFIWKLRKYKGIEAKQVAKGMMVTALRNNESFKIFESDEIQKL